MEFLSPIFSWLTSIGGGVSTLRDAFLGPNQVIQRDHSVWGPQFPLTSEGWDQCHYINTAFLTHPQGFSWRKILKKEPNITKALSLVHLAAGGKSRCRDRVICSRSRGTPEVQQNPWSSQRLPILSLTINVILCSRYSFPCLNEECHKSLALSVCLLS